jgi:hypothetical protein
MAVFLGQAWVSRGGIEWGVVRRPSLHSLVQGIVHVEDALSGRKRGAGGDLRRLRWLTRRAGLQYIGNIGTCQTIDEAIGCLEFAV